MTDFFIIGGAAGVGKTTLVGAIVDKGVKRGERYIIVQPTKELQDETYAQLKLRSVDKVYCINGDGDAGSVIKRIDEHLKKNSHPGQILLITMAAFDMVPFFNKPGNWNLFIDEVPSAIKAMNPRIPVNHAPITQHLMLNDNGEYASLGVKKRRAIEKIRENKANDVLFAELNELTTTLLAEDWEVYVNSERYDNLITGKVGEGELEAYALRTMERLKKFKSCTIVGARIKESFFYLIATFYGIKFKPYPNLPARFGVETHANGALLEIHYMPVKRWSQAAAERHSDKLKNYVEYAGKLFGTEEFLWLGNVKGPKCFGQVNCTKLSGAPHGLNKYDHIDNIVVTAAYNPSIKFSRFLRYLNLSTDQIDVAMHVHRVYQAVLRTSLRDQKNSLNPSIKRVVVPDLRTANWLLTVFPDAKMIEIPQSGAVDSVGKVGRKRLYKDDAERKRAQRARDRLCTESVDRKEGKKEDTGENLNDVVREDTGQTPVCHDITIDMSSFVTATPAESSFHVNIYNSIYSFGADTKVSFESSETISYWLGLKSSNSIPIKERNQLFNTTKFRLNENGTESKKAKYIESIHGIILDNDGGGITVDEFIKRFPKIRMAVFNTFSSTPEFPRWRVFIPTTRYMSLSEYEACWDGLLDDLRTAGFALPKPDPQRPYERAHGFDMSKKTPSSIFYLPCRAKAPGGSFFDYHEGEGRELLDPTEWIKSHPPQVARVAEDLSTSKGLDTYTHTQGEESCIERWRVKNRNVSEGNTAWFGLIQCLAQMNQTLDGIEAIVEPLIVETNSPEDRRADTRRALEWLAEHPEAWMRAAE